MVQFSVVAGQKKFTHELQLEKEWQRTGIHLYKRTAWERVQG